MGFGRSLWMIALFAARATGLAMFSTLKSCLLGAGLSGAASVSSFWACAEPSESAIRVRLDLAVLLIDSYNCSLIYSTKFVVADKELLLIRYPRRERVSRISAVIIQPACAMAHVRRGGELAATPRDFLWGREDDVADAKQIGARPCSTDHGRNRTPSFRAQRQCRDASSPTIGTTRKSAGLYLRFEIQLRKPEAVPRGA